MSIVYSAGEGSGCHAHRSASDDVGRVTGDGGLRDRADGVVDVVGVVLSDQHRQQRSRHAEHAAPEETICRVSAWYVQ
jgi:hypothetical protein